MTATKSKLNRRVRVTQPTKLKKLRISIPVSPNGGVDSHLIEWMFGATLDTAARDRGWAIERAICRDRPVVSTRNRLVKQFLDSDCDALLTIDSDQIPQNGAEDMVAGLDHMLDAINKPEVDVVNAITLRGTDKGPVPVISKVVAPLRTDLFAEILEKPRGLHELVHGDKVGCMGGAAILVTREVLERFREENIPWFWDVFAENQAEHFDELSGEDLWGQRIIGHDYWFFMKCHELGFRCWVDTRAFWGHVKPCDLRGEWRREMELLATVRAARRTPAVLGEVMREMWGEMHNLKGGENWAAGGAFIGRMVDEVLTLPEDQIVVECGSGLTSMILTRLLPKERLVILEHDKHWFQVVQPYVNGSLHYAPLQDFGDYEWYRLPEISGEVGLVVVDGPPGDTRGGRSGAMHQLWPHLATKFTLLLDDAGRESSADTLKTWERLYALGTTYHDDSHGRSFAVVKHTKTAIQRSNGGVHGA